MTTLDRPKAAVNRRQRLALWVAERAVGWASSRDVRDLTADPRIEALETRRELEAEQGRWWLGSAIVAVVLLSCGQLFVSNWFAVPLALASGALGYVFDRWQGTRDPDERTERDVRTLTTVYHESPATIRRWLTSQFIDDSIKNLLAASLDSEELGHAYWRQAVRPFLDEAERGYKSAWRYQIDIAELSEVETLRWDGIDHPLTASTHRRLRTSVTYIQSVPSPSEMYYVAAVFDGSELPGWFKDRPNFLLRELAGIPDELVEALRSLPASPKQLPDRFDDVAPLDDELSRLAGQVLRATVMVGEERLRPCAVYVDHTGISWGFHFDADLREQLRRSTQVRVDLDTFMARTQRLMPVVIAAPTRNPIVQLNYALSDIDCVETNVFFSAERPWDGRLRTEDQTFKRVDVLTERDDWVFAGSGCLFSW